MCCSGVAYMWGLGGELRLAGSHSLAGDHARTPLFRRGRLNLGLRFKSNYGQMAFALKAGSACLPQRACRLASTTGSAVLPRRPLLASRSRRYISKVAAIEEQETEALQPSLAASPLAAPSPEEQALAEELELQELDEAQEDLLKWMLFLDEEAQEEDLDEMVDYDEFGDEEYEEIFEDVEAMMEASDYELKPGDKVVGTVYECDEDGAYVEIGAKSAGFVPLSECSLARLKSVSGRLSSLPGDISDACTDNNPCSRSLWRSCGLACAASLWWRSRRTSMERSFSAWQPWRCGIGPEPHAELLGACIALCMRGSGGMAQSWRRPARRSCRSTGALTFARPSRAWRLQATTFYARIRQIQEEDIPVYATVTSVNRGGLSVMYHHLEGFVPISQCGPVSSWSACPSAAARARAAAVSMRAWGQQRGSGRTQNGAAGTAAHGPAPRMPRASRPMRAHVRQLLKCSSSAVSEHHVASICASNKDISSCSAHVLGVQMAAVVCYAAPRASAAPRALPPALPLTLLPLPTHTRTLIRPSTLRTPRS